MSETLQAIAAAIHAVAGVEPGAISADTHIFDDLGVDSLDFLDIVFDLDRAFGVKLPVEDWLARVEQDEALRAELFTIGNLMRFIDAARAKV